ncbi:NADPH oxidase organizer 1a [Cyclopterus lumpus]|uniref:NADPH oxidase organizer 1a n=1 Tax=Cyclopterus lumpus TaxID=8103 RepID=A0A8C3AR55_CYCLU|nr:NADPH oxidase organizer 1a [Cyclopterus lumpus]
MEAPSYPFSVSLIGVLHKEKCKMYMTSVLWSDQTEIVVYRTYPDFKTMHKQLKKAFPMAHNTKHSDRILPKFRDKRVTAGSQKKGPTQSLQRLRFLQKYCNKLLTCDPQVCQSADLIQFFRPREEDLQPEFSKNCIMILPSDDEVRAEAGPVKGGGNVTQPFVTETYRCVAAYETKDTKNKPFKVVLDEKVDVLIKDQAGWWLVENENKKMAWFPAPYLGKLDDDDEDDEEDDVNGSPEQGVMYTTVKSYKATKDDEITVAIGAVVEVLQKSANGWWLIRYNGKGGYIPTMYLKPYNYPHIRMTGNQPDRRFSSPNQILSPTLQLQSNQLSLSQGNLPQLRSSSPKLLPMPGQQRSHSLDISSVQLPDPPAAHTAAYVATSPTTAKCYPPPAIMVEMDGEEDQRGMSPGPDSDGSFSIYSDGSDDLNSSWTSSLSFNLSKSYHEEQLRRVSHTPLPMGGNYLSPTSITEGRLVPSVSEPNLYKGPTSPKVPPRPRAQEILTRCTTVTRKNASKDPLKPR